MFCMEVLKCLSRDYLTKERVRTNSRRAREYMVAYFILSLKETLKETSNSPQATNSNQSAVNISLEELQPCAVSAQKIEQMKQKVRTHRAAFDFDKSFCTGVSICEFDEQCSAIKREK